MNTAPLLVAIPMKDPRFAKSRLASVLPKAARQRLAMALYKQTLRFFKEFRKTSGVAYDLLVVTSCPKVAALAQDYGAHVLDETGYDGLNGAVNAAAGWATTQRYSALCIVPADIADHDADEFTRLLSCELKNNSLVICPSYDQGTNALLVSLPTALPFAYGKKSFHRHLAAADQLGMTTRILPLPGIAQDIDSSSDLINQHPQFSERLGMASAFKGAVR